MPFIKNNSFKACFLNRNWLGLMELNNDMDYREFSKKDEAWISEFERVMRKAPRNLFLFVGSGSLVIYSERRMDGSDGNGVNPNVPSRNVTTKMMCDGGDW